MIQFIAGEKGQGKTKLLIDMANEATKTTDGHLVFIESDSRHMYDLHYDVRFVETASFPLSNYREFVGFLCGILSQDSDIKTVYVDGLTKVVKTMDNDGLLKLLPKLEKLSIDNSVDFVIAINFLEENLPQEIKSLVLNI